MTDKTFGKVVGTVAGTLLTAGAGAPIAVAVLGSQFVKHAVQAVISDGGNEDGSQKRGKDRKKNP